MKTIETVLGNIVGIEKLGEGQYKLIQAVPDEVQVANSSIDDYEEKWVLVEAEELSKADSFMSHRPKNAAEKNIKKLITQAIDSGVKNFYRPKCDPSFKDDGICFAPNRKPALGKSFDWWVEAAKIYNPRRDSRIGTRLEYAAFLGVIIKKLVESGCTIDAAWDIVCTNSSKIGHYKDSANAKTDFELTGSRENFGFCDLANTYKMMAADKHLGGFWLACGDCKCTGSSNPLSFFYHYAYRDINFVYAVGWVVCS